MTHINTPAIKTIFCTALSALSFNMLGTSASASEITCTATPDCASLGYTKSASQCPDGGMKCPFDSSKMFCVNAEALDFVFQNKIAVGHIVYSDGTTSTTYTSTKLPIGIVVYVHPNGKNNHGLVLAIDAPLPRTRAEANLYCDSYVTKGTKIGDWHLPDAGEVWMYSNANPDYTYKNFEEYLSKVPGGDGIYAVKSWLFGYSYGYNTNYYGRHSFIGETSSQQSTSYYPWTTSERYSNAGYVILPHINNNFSHTSNTRVTYYNNFRCVAQL